MFAKYIISALLASAVPAWAAFGVTETDKAYVADTGSSNGFVVTIARGDGSITSLKYRSTEYQYASQTSHIGSGLGSADVSYKILNGEFLRPPPPGSSGHSQHMNQPPIMARPVHCLHRRRQQQRL